MSIIFHHFLHPLLRLFFLRRCAVCGVLLRNGEEVLCLECEAALPLTDFGYEAGNPAERLFWGRVPIVRATSLLYYGKGDGHRQLILQLKYMGRKDIGRWLGRLAGELLMKEGFFEGIDLLVPVPLHSKRLRRRGFNQSLCIAQGIAQATGIPVAAHGLRRIADTDTQTHKLEGERWHSMRGAFSLDPKASVQGKHLLLIDDVLTTGATLSACAETILQASTTQQSGTAQQSGTTRISIFTLGFAQHG